MKRIRIIVTGVVLLVMLYCFNSPAYAATENDVYAGKAKSIGDDLIVIPISIKNNTGFMGFKIELEYPLDELKIYSITKGDILNGGILSDNNKPEYSNCSVMWSGTNCITEDGVLFYLGVQLQKQSSHISLSYSQEDTFDEEWKDVVLEVHDVDVDKNDIVQFEKDEGTNGVTYDLTNAIVKDYVKTENFSEEVEETFEGIGIDDFEHAQKEKDKFFEEYKKKCKNKQIKLLLERYPENIKKSIEKEALKQYKNRLIPKKKRSNQRDILVVVIVILLGSTGLFFARKGKRCLKK